MTPLFLQQFQLRKKVKKEKEEEEREEKEKETEEEKEKKSQHKKRKSSSDFALVFYGYSVLIEPVFRYFVMNEFVNAPVKQF